jgi:hypothetical protein
MSNTTSQSSVILHTEKDWDSWIELIKSAALKFELWEYINPYTAKDKVPVLSEPEQPSPTSIRGTATPAEQREGSSSLTISEIRFSDLNASEQTQLQMLQSIYLHQLRKHERRVEAMGEVRNKVQNTIHKDNFGYTRDCNTVWEMVYNLKERFAPNDKARERDVLGDWIQATKKPGRGTEINKWLQDLETAYNEAVKLKLPEVLGLHPHYTFTEATAELEPNFSYE